MNIHCDKDFEAARLHAEKTNDESLQRCLDTFAKWEEKGNVINLYSDHAPLSFFFTETRPNGTNGLCGGVIYHGSHDNGGDGSAPTYSVCLTPTNGWTIHT